jgi:L-seryl-tRNA(Ser) seleniumtransferase
VGKEEAIAMLAAVEQWMKRDHDAEWKQWMAWLDEIAGRVTDIEGVTTTVVQPEGLSNHTPSLKVLWERDRLGVAGDAIVKTLLDTDPRIALFAARGDSPTQTGVSITPYMLLPGDASIVAKRLHEVLSHPPQAPPEPAPAAAVTDLSGQWNVQIDFAATTSTHTLHLRQRGNDLDGAHQGEFVSRSLTGTIDGNRVRLHSAYGEQHGDSLNYTFSGTVTGDDEMGGDADLGEYLRATWKASRPSGGTN